MLYLLSHIEGLIKSSKNDFSTAEKFVPNIASYISLSLSIPRALKNVNNGITPVTDGNLTTIVIGCLDVCSTGLSASSSESVVLNRLSKSLSRYFTR